MGTSHDPRRRGGPWAVAPPAPRRVPGARLRGRRAPPPASGTPRPRRPGGVRSPPHGVPAAGRPRAAWPSSRSTSGALPRPGAGRGPATGLPGSWTGCARSGAAAVGLDIVFAEPDSGGDAPRGAGQAGGRAVPALGPGRGARGGARARALRDRLRLHVRPARRPPVPSSLDRPGARRARGAPWRRCRGRPACCAASSRSGRRPPPPAS